MSHAQLWSLHSGPEIISVENPADWSAWRWSVANGDEVRAVTVYVATEVMVSDVELRDRGRRGQRDIGAKRGGADALHAQPLRRHRLHADRPPPPGDPAWPAHAGAS